MALSDSESDGGDFNPVQADLSDDETSAPVAKSSTKREIDETPAIATNGSVKGEGEEQEDDDDDDDDQEDFKDNQESRRDAAPADEDEDDDDDGEEVGDDDEEDEDEEDIPRHRRKRHKESHNAFFDIEAEVEDEDEDGDEERDGEEIGDFIDHAPLDEVAETGNLNDDRYHRELDRRKELADAQDVNELAKGFQEKYGGRRARGGLGDANIVPKRLLLPSVEDPSIWAVRCKEGKEREVVFSIMKAIEEKMGTRQQLAITSAFERGGPQSVMKGYVYIEARRQTDILKALDGLLNVYPRSNIVLVQIKDMPDLLRVTKTPTLEPGAWVRLRRPLKHAGDLAQVLDVTENGLEARVRFIPRLDYGVREEIIGPDGKRKRAPVVPGTKPPQKLFSEIEARKRAPRNLQGNPQTNSWAFNGDEFEGGFQVKDIKIQQLSVKDVNPTLEEVTRFASSAEDGAENLDLKALAASLKDNAANVTYLPGDIIEVYSGEQAGVVGKVTGIQGEIVTLQVTEGDLLGQVIEVPAKGLRKRFRPGDHVKVISGSRYRDEVGMVVKITDDRVTFLTDQTNTEVTVFSKDLREASDIGGQGSLGQYALLDLVQLDPTTVGCIVKVDRESLVVLDQNGDTRQTMPSQIANKLPKRKLAIASDRDGSEIRLDDVVKEAVGQGRQGKIIHIHRAFVFLHNNDSNENAGVFVTRSGNLKTIAAKGGRINAASSGPDLNQMNPALKRNPSGGNGMEPPKASFGRDKTIGQTVTIRKGGYKGLLGIVKDTTDTHARVELHTKGKIVTVPKGDLTYKDKVTGRVIDITARGGYGGSSSYGGASSGRSIDSGFQGSRTPIITSGSDRVPAWGVSQASSKTPMWNGGGSRTPAFGDGSRTVNPYDGSRTAYGGGSRTPAWASGAKTPAYDGFGAGSRTPAYGGGGDAWGAGSKTPGYGASAPTPGASGHSWGATPGGYGGYDAPTPGAGLGGPTPGALDAPTPGGYGAPTPAPIDAPTPGGPWQGGWGDSAPTPAAGAPTPAASGGGYYGAPTPGAYAAETPAASGPRYTDDD